MSNRPKKGVLTDSPLIALAVAAALLLSICGPTSAQFFNFGGYQDRPQPQRGGGWFGGGWFNNNNFDPFRQRAPQERRQSPPPREDFSKAPPPEKREAVASRNVLVIGDAMADWLAYGLEDVYSDQPDMGVIRKHKSASGLIKYQPKGEPADWIAAAKGILATEKADAIVVMLGLNDRVPIREPAAEKPADKKGDGKDARKPESKQGKAGAANAEGRRVDSELPPDDADKPAAPEKAARSPNGLSEFRDERWVDLYNKKIDDLIGVLKSKGVPVLWVGLPAVRGPKGTSDMLFLDALYREGAAKGGITYVDVWDGFVDDAGQFLQKGPDFEGQIRQLRSYDGVFFTKAGARKLAHYVGREIARALARSAPIALPSEPAAPNANAVPGQPTARPLAGPILPLLPSSIASDQLLGGPGSRAAAVDSLAMRVLVKGEPLSPPAGRADDSMWPRREIGREQIKGDPLAASAAIVSTASRKQKKLRR